MDTSPAKIDSVSRTTPSRRWRSVFAGLISLALVLSFFHGWAFDTDDGGPAFSVAQSSGDASGKSPAHPPSPHGDHCLTHVASVATQDAVLGIDYGAHAYRIVSVRAPASADLLSPFKPPRA
ncbi:hypothetical protein JQ604_11395 [Bradyrhizobium jicamae]|uniref:hypothetical protein n=1 Tax=Bradyrhizobium jicamae TaxID=280332 RepID=UPI001BA98589|nr:hypothetical protein [Bradyrhizobium jicamae]MBR0752789.1 hypothetical protein [Bradyrhizobium jicamae]